jgi:hypothetical protein
MFQNDLDEFEIRWQRALAATRSLDCLLANLSDGKDPNATDVLRLLASGDHNSSSPALSALGYYRCMQEMLNEEEFRWATLEFPKDTQRTKVLRRERFTQYHRHRELFDLEISVARKQKRATMALSHDWSGMADYVAEGLQLAKYRCMLRLAGLLYRSGIPGALDVCDAAAFAIFRLTYSPTFPP